MQLTESYDNSPLTVWRDTEGQVRIAAGDADSVLGFVTGQTDRNWRILGSQDQRDEIFLAACPSVPAGVLNSLTMRGDKLLPGGIVWDEIGLEDLKLFTVDSGDIVLRLE